MPAMSERVRHDLRSRARSGEIEKLRARFGGNVVERGVLAQLQRANVGHDGPAVARRDLRGVVGHGAESVANHVVDVSVRDRPEPVDVVRGRLAKAAADDHAVAIAQPVVAGRAVDVEPALAALDDFLGDREREVGGGLAVGALALEVSGVVVEVAAGDGALDQRALGAAVGEEIRGAQRDVLRLVVHVLAAGAKEKDGQAQRGDAEHAEAHGGIPSRGSPRDLGDLRGSALNGIVTSAQLRTPPWPRATPGTTRSPPCRRAGRSTRCRERSGCPRPSQSAAR
jgi:hypothetical protein